MNNKIEYIHGIIDMLRYIMAEELTLEKIEAFHQKILESFNLNFEKYIFELMEKKG